MSDIELFRDGAALVADLAENTISKFDASGALMWKVGKRGSGPGEFLTASLVAPCADGRAWVADVLAQRLTLLAPDGALLRSRPVDVPMNSMDDLLCVEQGGVIIAGVTSSEQARGSVLHRFDGAGDYLRSFAMLDPSQSPQLLSLWGVGSIYRVAHDTIMLARWVPLRLERYAISGSLLGSVPLADEPASSLDALFTVVTDKFGEVASITDGPGATAASRLTGFVSLSNGRSLVSLGSAESSRLALLDSLGRTLRTARLPVESWNQIGYDASKHEVQVGMQRGEEAAVARFKVPASWQLP